MKFGLFYELSVPRRWTRESERTVYDNALEQVKLADELGFTRSGRSSTTSSRSIPTSWSRPREPVRAGRVERGAHQADDADLGELGDVRHGPAPHPLRDGPGDPGDSGYAPGPVG
jgi:hypothetical protein